MRISDIDKNKHPEVDFSDLRDVSALPSELNKFFLEGLNGVLSGGQSLRLSDEERSSIENTREALSELIGYYDDGLTIARMAEELDYACADSIFTRSRLMMACFLAGTFLGSSELQKKIIRAQAQAAYGSTGGKKSGEARRVKRKWVSHAEDIARRYYAEDPGAPQDRIASEILGAWKLGKVNPPSHETLKRHIARMIKENRLPKRVMKQLRSTE